MPFALPGLLIALLGAGPIDDLRPTIDRHIADLGHPDFEVRERAFLRLERIGGPAYDAVEAATRSPDAEVRMRAGLLVASLRKSDLDRRVKRFLDDPQAKELPKLPGLAVLLERAGDTPETRTFYADCLRDPGLRKLLLVADSTTAGIATGVQAHVAEMVQQRQRGLKPPPPGLVVRPVLQAVPNRAVAFNDGPFSLTEILGVFLIDSLASEESRKVRRLGNTPTTLLYQNVLRNTLLATNPTPAQGAQARIARAVLANWFETREEATELSISITYGNQYQMPESVIVAATKQMMNKAATGPNRGMALAGLAKGLGPKALPLLEKHLTDKTQGGIRYETTTDENGRMGTKQTPIEIRDIALASILHLTKRDPKQYGMQVYSTVDTMLFQSTNAWFKTDEDRKKAFEKFEAEQAKAKKP
jgi:hypothetical protein